MSWHSQVPHVRLVHVPWFESSVKPQHDVIDQKSGETRDTAWVAPGRGVSIVDTLDPWFWFDFFPELLGNCVVGLSIIHLCDG